MAPGGAPSVTYCICTLHGPACTMVGRHSVKIMLSDWVVMRSSRVRGCRGWRTDKCVACVELTRVPKERPRAAQPGAADTYWCRRTPERRAERPRVMSAGNTHSTTGLLDLDPNTQTIECLTHPAACIKMAFPLQGEATDLVPPGNLTRTSAPAILIARFAPTSLWSSTRSSGTCLPDCELAEANRGEACLILDMAS